jgi:hypothetical protein
LGGAEANASGCLWVGVLWEKGLFILELEEGPFQMMRSL